PVFVGYPVDPQTIGSDRADQRQNPLDTQNPSSYISATKKQLFITLMTDGSGSSFRDQIDVGVRSTLTDCRMFLPMPATGFFGQGGT
ncbi:MAG: hypothetical protein ACOYOS_14915, partial [Syntrophales bacterium]